MASSLIVCDFCGKEHLRSNGHINRSKKLGAPLYCGRACSGVAKRNNKTLEQKKAKKRSYDKEYRAKNKQKIKDNKAKYYKDNLEKFLTEAKKHRNCDKHRERHRNYCSQPEYRYYKHKYDVVRGMIKNYGEFWECGVLVNAIEREIIKWIPKNERHYYINNVRNQTLRSNRRRLEEAIRKIECGESDKEILRRNWSKSSRALLNDLLIK